VHTALATPLAGLTTLRVGGPASRLVEAATEAELVEAVRRADDAGEPVLILAGGSNVVVADHGFDGTVVRVSTRGVTVDGTDDCVVGAAEEPTSCGGDIVTAEAGESWDDLVATAVRRGWVGIEALSGIPGSVGATPIQNVGAYGQEVAQTLWSVRTYDRQERGIRTFANADCGFGYRTSRFKRDDRYVVLQVSYQLGQGDLGAPISYAELARALSVRIGERVSLSAVREAVLALRRGKGMVIDPDDHDTWSAGSFFTNPVLPAERAAGLPDAAPRWTQPDGSVKTSAAWLIERAGFGRGYGRGAARLSTKHTLAVTNRGAATTSDVLELAREVRTGVRARFGIELVNEPVLVGCEL